MSFAADPVSLGSAGPVITGYGTDLAQCSATVIDALGAPPPSLVGRSIGAALSSIQPEWSTTLDALGAELVTLGGAVESTAVVYSKVETQQVSNHEMLLNWFNS